MSIFGFGMTKTEFLLIPWGSRSVTFLLRTPLWCAMSNMAHLPSSVEPGAQRVETVSFGSNFWPMAPSMGRLFLMPRQDSGDIHDFKFKHRSNFHGISIIHVHSCSIGTSYDLYLVFTNSPGICHRTHIYIYICSVFSTAPIGTSSFRPLCRFHPMLPS